MATADEDTTAPAASVTPVDAPTVSRDAIVAAKPAISGENAAETVPNGVAASQDHAPAPKKRGRKRKVSEAEDKKATAADAKSGSVAAAAEATAAAKDDETESEGEQPSKKTKAVAKPKKTPGRKKKPVPADDSETEDEGQSELFERIEKLPEAVKAMFGKIVWVKMAGYPYWPALVTDPRRLKEKFQTTALKDVENRHYVRFYGSWNFTASLFKNIEKWDDSKHDYRTGHPAKDAKAPKRREKLMAAIQLADKDALLPVDERMDGLLKVVEVVKPAKAEKKAEKKIPQPPTEKKKRGRPLGSKNKPKVPVVEGKAQVAEAQPKPKRGRKKAAQIEEELAQAPEPQEEASEAGPSTPEEDEDTSAAPVLSKEEIKAKVASRKAPSKKKADDKSSAPAKKAPKAAVPTKTEGTGKAASEIDTKRKKEIELVVPRKSVKSADIREATEEAARKKLTGTKEKAKDKVDYKLGSLSQFTGKMNRLHANESSKNNDELILMLSQLFEEKLVYRTDVERSGLASVISVLRKSTNPTVAQTASAVRKHLMKILNNDVVSDASASKKHKPESDEDGKPAKKQKAAEAASSSPTGGSKEEAPKATSEPGKKSNAAIAKPAKATEPKPTTIETSKAGNENQPSVTNKEPKTETKVATAPKVDAKKAEPAKKVEASRPVPTSPKKTRPEADILSTPKPDPSGDKSRVKCIEMLAKALESNGDKNVKIAKEIEEQVYDRFKESNDEYRACAREITFGLKKDAKARERLFNGTLHALELAYSPDAIFKAL